MKSRNTETKEEILNIAIKDLVDYCDNHNCSECPYESICLYKTHDNKIITLISMLSFNIEKNIGKDKIGRD